MLCFALSGYSLSANVMETLVKKGMKIEERVDSVTLAPKVIEKLRANIDNAEYPLLYSFSNIS